MNAMKDWDNVFIVDTVFTLERSDLKFVFTPYVPNGRFEEAMNTIGDDWRDADCIFAHQEFAGCKMGAIVSIDGDKWSEDYPEIVSGHIHSRQTPQPNVYYTGSAMQHAFGESDKNIIPVLEFEPGSRYKLREVDLELPRKRIVYMDMDKVDTFNTPETSDQLKITLTGNYDEFKSFKKSEKYKDLTKNGTKVVFKAKKDSEATKPQQQTSGFREILYDLVMQTRDEALLEFYELVVNNKKISEDDIIIL
jgi:hypothetical protein